MHLALRLKPQAAPDPESCQLLWLQDSQSVCHLPELGASFNLDLPHCKESHVIIAYSSVSEMAWPTDAGDDVDDQETDKWQQEQTPVEGQEGAEPAGQQQASDVPAEPAGRMRFHFRTKTNIVSGCLQHSHWTQGWHIAHGARVTLISPVCMQSSWSWEQYAMLAPWLIWTIVIMVSSGQNDCN